MLTRDCVFLEIKFKNNKGRTDKKRIRITDFDMGLEGENREFVTKVMHEEIPLTPKIWNTFTRLTLVHNTEPERLTIDLDLGFEYEDDQGSLSKIVIAEVKQEKQSRNSTFVQTVKQMAIRPMGFSKYCMGTALLNRHLKYNNFKERFLTVNEISNERVY